MRFFRTTQLLDFARNITVSFLKISSLRRLIDSPLNLGRITATSDIFLTHLLHQSRWAWASKGSNRKICWCEMPAKQIAKRWSDHRVKDCSFRFPGQWTLVEAMQCSTHPQEYICWRFLLMTFWYKVQSTAKLWTLAKNLVLVEYSWTNWGQTETNWIQDEDLKFLSSVAYIFLYASSPAVIHHDLFLKVGISVQKTCTWKEQQVLGGTTLWVSA